MLLLSILTLNFLLLFFIGIAFSTLGSNAQSKIFGVVAFLLAVGNAVAFTQQMTL
jgi:hypothetical protein